MEYLFGFEEGFHSAAQAGLELTYRIQLGLELTADLLPLLLRYLGLQVGVTTSGWDIIIIIIIIIITIIIIYLFSVGNIKDNPRHEGSRHS